MENHEPTSEPKKRFSVDGVLDELRSVLAGLTGESTPPPMPPPASPPPPMSEPAGFHESGFPSQNAAEPPRQPNGSSSDADFWKGNVLGWPSAPDAPATPAEPAPKAEPAPESVPLPSFADQHFFNEPLPPAPPPVNTPLPPKTESSFEKPALEGSPFSLDASLSAPDFSIPEPPQPPSEKTEKPAEPNPWAIDDPIKETSAPVLESPLDALNQRVAEQQASDAPQSPEFSPALPQDHTIPIPETVTEKKEPEKPKAEEAGLKLDVTEMKPSGLVQIACMFPEGQERVGQQFVSKLRELGEKSKSKLKITPVFINAWNVENVDTAAWAKSATLSGADVMFIMFFKKDMELFKQANLDPLRTGVRTRLVTMEQAASRMLYADIVIELERGR